MIHIREHQSHATATTLLLLNDCVLISVLLVHWTIILHLYSTRPATTSVLLHPLMFAKTQLSRCHLIVADVGECPPPPVVAAVACRLPGALCAPVVVMETN